MSGRNYTADLRRAQREGALVVGAAQPREGWGMDYRPRRKGDPLPWVAIADPTGPRYNGRECKAVTSSGGGPWAVARLVRLGGAR
jgi:hypothetical protein